MKKLIIVLLVAVASQSALAQNVSFGPSVGFGHSWLTGAQNVTFKPGFNIGGTLTYSPSTHWGLGGDIRASFLEGVKTKTSVTGATYENSLNATYLRVPLKLTYFFGKYGNRVHPKLFAGPSFGFLLGGKNKFSSGTVSSETKTKDLLESFDFGVLAGVGFNYRLKRYTWLNVDVTYTNGLLDATKNAGFNSTRNIALNIGVTFPLGTVTK